MNIYVYVRVHIMKSVFIFWDIMLIMHDHHPQKLTNFETFLWRFINLSVVEAINLLSFSPAVNGYS